MTPEQFKRARRVLGLSAKGMAEALGMGPTSGRTIRRWERGDRDIPGPAIVAVRYMLKEKTSVERTPEADNG